ncbi:P-loop containing nucleoside triphosphate hydrolase protein [Aspergillus venezuelensis]
MDLLSILPNFPIRPYSHILPPLERSHINTVDLISLDTLEIAKRAHVPLSDVRRLAQQVIKALHNDVGFEEVPLPEQENGPEQEQPDSSLDIDRPLIAGPRTKLDLSEWCTISSLDPALNDLLNGGVASGYVTEVTGESGCGKTQFLLGLLLAVQLPKPRGAGKSAIYISTEAPLATNRLSQLIESHPELAGLSRDERPSLGKILSINAMDLESQDHILNYQLPVAIKRYDVGLVVIDSVTSNYRAEHTSHDLSGLSTRSGELAKLGQMLRNLAASENIAIVVANQVSDRFEGEDRLDFRRLAGDRTPVSSQQAREFHPFDREAAASPLARLRPSESGNAELNQNLAMPQSTPNFPSSSPLPTQEEPAFDGSYLVGNPVRNEILSLQRQQRFFTGWGDIAQPWTQSVYRPSLKTPTLGLVWATQVACRIALKKYIRPVSLDPLKFENAAYSTPVQIPKEGEAFEFKVPATAPVRYDGDQAHPDDSTAAAGRVLTSSDPSPFQPTQQPIQRTMKLVFSPWAGGPTPDVPGSEFQDEVEFEIWKGGIRAVKRSEDESEQ